MEIKVILADDHQVLRESLSVILDQDPGIKVVGQAENGREVVRLCPQLKPDIVVMDINMPELNGVEATRQILIDQPSIQVIMLSMSATKEHIYQAFQAGVRGYLIKESSVMEVIDAIKAVSEGKRYISSQLTDTVIDDYFIKRNGEEHTNPLDRLSSRERQILQLVAEGKSSKAIAELLNLSVSSVSTYRSRLMKKIGLNDLTELIKFAVEYGIIDSN
jgi:two-component system, NarL family, response regulator NreC